MHSATTSLQKGLPDRIFEKSQSQSKESLVWDHSDETTPSFVTNSWESDQLEEALQNLYRSWDTSDKEQNPPLESTPIASRRNTSTDHRFLSGSVAPNPPYHHSWPPRYPSQEPEEFSLDHSLLKNTHSIPQLVTIDLDDTVFEENEKESDPEEALFEVGVGIVHVLREDLALIGNPYFSKTTVKF